jgi:hypothetical protein
MGLALEVGILADLKEADAEGFAYFKEQFGILNQFLSGARLGTHVEPEELDKVFSCSMYGYSGLHYLRRVGAHLALGRPIPPPGDKEAAHDPILERDYWNRFLAGKYPKYQHLIVHSDAEGFYVPIDFKGALVATDDIPLLGGMLGSTQQLQAECRELADVLGVPAGLDAEADEIMSAIETQGQGLAKWQQYAVETFTCLQLIAACDASLRTKAAIVFA